MAGFVQQGTSLYGVNPPQSLTITGVTAGHALIVPIGRTSSASRDYVISSDLDGSFGTAIATSAPASANFPQYVFILYNASAGNHTISITQVSGTNQPMHATVIEADGLDALATPITSAFWDGTNDGAHHSAAVGEIDTTVASFMVSCAWLNGTNGGGVAGSGFQALTSANAQAFYQYRDSTSGESDQRGEFTNTGTARHAYACIVAFPYGASAATLTGGASASSAWSVAAGSLTAQAVLAGATAQSTWATAGGSLSAAAVLAGATASSAWATATGSLTAAAVLSGSTATSAWAVAGGALTTAGMVSLVGDSAVASWVSPSGVMTFAASLAGATPTSVWTIPVGGSTLQASLTGGTPVSTWGMPLGTLDAAAVLNGSGAVSTWSVPTGAVTLVASLTGLTPSAEWTVPVGTLNPGALVAYEVIRIANVTARTARGSVAAGVATHIITAGVARTTISTSEE